MPTDQLPTDLNEPKEPTENSPAPETCEDPRATSPVVRGSRWVDYDTHELLQMINELEDERRWARLREGIWLAVLIHLVLLSLLNWIPKYVFKAPLVVDHSSQLKEHKDFTYLDTPAQLPPPVVKPLPLQHPLIDKQTMDTMKRVTPSVPEPAPQSALQAPAPPPPPPSQQQTIEAPRPSAVPARPNFSMGSQNPAEQLRDAMKGSYRGPEGMGNLPPSHLPMHPGASTGGVQILSDTQGVDFSSWLNRAKHETERAWDPLIPDEVNAPIYKSGSVVIHFKVLPNGRVMDGSMLLDGRSGDVALDRAAWGAIQGSNYPPLPRDFHGPFLELRVFFTYNPDQQ